MYSCIKEPYMHCVESGGAEVMISSLYYKCCSTRANRPFSILFPVYAYSSSLTSLFSIMTGSESLLDVELESSLKLSRYFFQRASTV